jgi:predicted GTPase
MTTARFDRIRVLVLGAAGRDFHNFNVVYRDDDRHEVVGFTATQIPDIAGRRYPPELAGGLYPEGIPIYDEAELGDLVRRLGVHLVVFAYSDVSYDYVMSRGALAQAAGADFGFLGPQATMIPSARPVVAITAVRTGSGKSQTTRAVAAALRGLGHRVAVIRHPMPYGDLTAQAVQRFATPADLDRAAVTIEEREEYEPHIDAGSVVFAGVDYARILAAAEKEADVVVWDGGNNDFPFFQSDVHIVVLDPLRAGHELRYYPGGINLRRAHVAVINKMDSATDDQIATVRASLAAHNPSATVIEADSTITVDNPEVIRDRRVVVVEDGPTLTHGEMAFGAGVVAAKRLGATVVDPHPYAVGSLAETYRKYPTTGSVVPAMGYSAAQIADLEATVNATPAEAVVIGTPIDLTHLIRANKPTARVRYELAPRKANLAELLAARLRDVKEHSPPRS